MASNLFYENTLSTTPIELAKLLGISVQALHKYNAEQGINTLIAPRKHRVFPAQTKEIIEKRNLDKPKICIHLHNSKGGVGKTTITHSAALKAATLGLRTLAIDLDPQSNLTKSFGTYQRSGVRPTFKSLVFGSFKGQAVNFQDTIVRLHSFLDLIPSDMSMANFDLELVLKSAQGGVNQMFKPIFDTLKKNYDIILVDSPPAISSVTLGATFNCDKLLIPTDPDEFAIDGIDQVFQQLKIATDAGVKVNPSICVNKLLQHRDHDLKKITDIYNTYGDYVLKSSLPFTSKYKEQLSEFKNIWTYSGARKPENITFLEPVIYEILGIDTWASNNKTSKTSINIMEESHA